MLHGHLLKSCDFPRSLSSRKPHKVLGKSVVIVSFMLACLHVLNLFFCRVCQIYSGVNSTCIRSKPYNAENRSLREHFIKIILLRD